MDQVSLLDQSLWPEESESLIGQIWLTGSTFGVKNKGPFSGRGAVSSKGMQDTITRRIVSSSWPKKITSIKKALEVLKTSTKAKSKWLFVDGQREQLCSFSWLPSFRVIFLLASWFTGPSENQTTGSTIHSPLLGGHLFFRRKNHSRCCKWLFLSVLGNKADPFEAISINWKRCGCSVLDQVRFLKAPWRKYEWRLPATQNFRLHGEYMRATGKRMC